MAGGDEERHHGPSHGMDSSGHGEGSGTGKSGMMMHGNGQGSGQEHRIPMEAGKDAGAAGPHAGAHGSGGSHHGMMVDFRNRFIVSILLTIPILALSPVIQSFFSFRVSIPAAEPVLLVLSSIVYFYGGWPFL